MRPISQYPQRPKPPIRFGSSSGGSGLTGITGAVDTLFRAFQSSRGKEMIAEDVVGFGVLRTGMDLHRNKMYGDDSLNVPAATERFAREILSILTDCVLGGVVALGVGKAFFDHNNQAFSKQFIQYPSLELFKDIASSKALKESNCPDKTQTAFREELARRFLADDKQPIPASLTHALNTVWNQKPDRKTINEQAKTLVSDLDKSAKDFTVELRVDETGKKAAFAANDLLDDVKRFSESMGEAWKNKGTQSITWQTMAHNAIDRTITAKNWMIPVGLAAGMTATFVSPFVLNGLTKKIFGIDYFPGETSLRKNQPQPAQANPQAGKSFWEKHFPYIANALKNGNPLPLIGSLAPLLAAVGAVDTNRLKFINPIQGLRNGSLKKLFDYTKAWPYTSQQQMAAMFALLITSRLLSSRSDNEYKERILDSAVGWGAWIIGTPLLKKAASKLLADRELLTKEGTLKSREAVAAFSEKALAKNVWVGVLSTLGTIGVLGIGAPLLGMKWTQRNEQRKQEKAALNQPVQKQRPLPSVPLMAAQKAFTPTLNTNPFAPSIIPQPQQAQFWPQANPLPGYSPNYAWPQR